MTDRQFYLFCVVACVWIVALLIFGGYHLGQFIGRLAGADA